jgi:hypothetical protein
VVRRGGLALLLGARGTTGLFRETLATAATSAALVPLGIRVPILRRTVGASGEADIGRTNVSDYPVGSHRASLRLLPSAVGRLARCRGSRTRRRPTLSLRLLPGAVGRLARCRGSRETANELGVARVTGQNVLEALVSALLNDEQLASRIRTEISRSVRQ